MAKKRAEVVIIMGSRSDWETMQYAARQLRELGIAHESRVVSAHRTPDRLYNFARKAKEQGVRVIIAGAGGAAHLPGMTASLTRLPVLGVPVESKTLKGLDSLLSIAQMPAGIPVGTLAIGKTGAINAALLAAAILALSDKALAKKLDKFRERQTKSVKKEAMILPGSTIGIIGGGQLGRMLAIAAARLGYKTHIFTPDEDSPASQVAFRTTVADYSDAAALEAFAAQVDVITFEFENIPHESLEMLERKKRVCPGANVLKICRNRLREKTFLNELGIATASFARVTSVNELKHAAMAVRFPAILKTAELGYDGKGQVTLKTGSDLRVAWESMHTNEAILESLVEFSMEISVIVARSKGGATRTYVPVQNIHKNHILDTTTVPAAVDKALADKAGAIAVKIAKAVKLQGLLAVEMFVDENNELLVNEMAPRPHNSGHWTIDACATSQFEQLIRAVCELPLGSTERRCDAQMKNLIGDEVNDWPKYLKDPNARLHLYGKKDVRPGRKMGHVTFLKSEG